MKEVKDEISQHIIQVKYDQFTTYNLIKFCLKI